MNNKQFQSWEKMQNHTEPLPNISHLQYHCLECPEGDRNQTGTGPRSQAGICQVQRWDSGPLGQGPRRQIWIFIKVTERKAGSVQDLSRMVGACVASAGTCLLIFSNLTASWPQKCADTLSLLTPQRVNFTWLKRITSFEQLEKAVVRSWKSISKEELRGLVTLVGHRSVAFAWLCFQFLSIHYMHEWMDGWIDGWMTMMIASRCSVAVRWELMDSCWTYCPFHLCLINSALPGLKDDTNGKLNDTETIYGRHSSYWPHTLPHLPTLFHTLGSFHPTENKENASQETFNLQKIFLQQSRLRFLYLVCSGKKKTKSSQMFSQEVEPIVRICQIKDNNDLNSTHK